MRIKMITIHNIANFGSVFQAMALNRYLKQCGHQCEVIDYNPPYFTKGSLRTRVGRLLNYRSYRYRARKYRDFVSEYMDLTSRNYTSNAELCAAQEEADIFLAGGDQLWNEFYDCGQDDAYKLTFTDGRKAAFGTSLGKNKFSVDGMRRLTDAVRSFEGIGIRERSGVELLQKAGIKQVCHVCDPIFLLSRDAYMKHIRPVPLKEKYVFVYLVQASELLNKAVEHISKAFGLKVVLYSGFISKCRSDIKIKELGPDETLSYLFNADFVLSASFHASAFSVMFHKRFITLLPGENTNSRIEDFLALLGLKERIATDEASLKRAIAEPIAWDKADHALEDHIDRSKIYLHDVLESSTFGGTSNGD